MAIRGDSINSPAAKCGRYFTQLHPVKPLGEEIATPSALPCLFVPPPQTRPHPAVAKDDDRAVLVLPALSHERGRWSVEEPAGPCLADHPSSIIRRVAAEVARASQQVSFGPHQTVQAINVVVSHHELILPPTLLGQCPPFEERTAYPAASVDGQPLALHHQELVHKVELVFPCQEGPG